MTEPLYICYRCLSVMRRDQMAETKVKGVYFNCCFKCKCRTFIDGAHVVALPTSADDPAKLT
jgi:hypothetical protein